MATPTIIDVCGRRNAIHAWLLAIAAAIGLTTGALIGVAHAQQLAPAANWNGFYLGINAGAGRGSADFRSATVDPAFIAPYQAYLPQQLAADLDASGGIFGAQAGFNWAIGSFVLGVEGDAQRMRLREARDTGFIPGPFPNDPGHRARFVDSVEMDMLYTLRGRLGFALDRLLLYGTAGWSWTEVKLQRDYDLLVGNNPYRSSFSDTMAGWTWGLGLEYALTRNWSLKGEYLSVNLGDTSLSQSLTANGTLNTSTIDLNLQIVRAGLNYKF